MRRTIRIATGLAVLMSFQYAQAVPSFARQTGLSCNVCHSNAPELTAFGRDFKLRGYVLAPPLTPTDRVGVTSGLDLTKNIPLSFMVLLSNTAFQNVAPATQNSAVGFPQQLSLFLAGGFASHFGALAQVTYSHSSDVFAMDNSDFRYANETTLGGKKLDYGVTLNNNPTVQDLWNSTPAWGFPYISSEATVGSIATPLIDGVLAQDVAGAGVYSMWNNHLYTEITAYRSEHEAGPVPVNGAGFPYNISAAAPYWRAAWQQNWGANYLMVGTYGIAVNSHPGAITGALDRYIDPALDFQYERPFGANLLDAHGTWIHENSNLNATFAAGGADAVHHTLNTFKLDSTYHWTTKYTATGALFTTTGTTDPLLYAAAPLTGSFSGSPNTSGYILQAAYWPVQNIDINVNYTGYTKFNGAGTNYDGAGRTAADNNSVYMALWIMF
ncbi:MAG: cytochrome C [Acidobacteria bacterium]|nr:cytochrome C [Acidobacteriota bacterium]